MKNKLKILYAEDEFIIRESIVKFLSNKDFFVKDFSNGEELLKEFQKEKYDLIITDVKMPKVNGIEVIKKVRNINDQIPIIIFTAYELSFFSDEIQSVLKHETVIMKPVLFNELYEKILACIYLECRNNGKE